MLQRQCSFCLRDDVEFAKRCFEFQATATGVSKSFSLDSNLSIRINQLPGFVDTLFSNKHLARKDQCLRSCAALSKTAFDQDFVDSFFVI